MSLVRQGIIEHGNPLQRRRNKYIYSKSREGQPMSIRSSFRLVAPVLLFASLNGAAFAHAHLLTADPAVNSMATPPPSELELRFTQDVVGAPAM
jgi:hypothetical protein